MHRNIQHTVGKVQNSAVEDHSDFPKYSVKITRIPLFFNGKIGNIADQDKHSAAGQTYFYLVTFSTLSLNNKDNSEFTIN